VTIVHCPLPVIGIVRTQRTSPEHTPVQAALNRGEHGTLEIAEPYAAGLADLDGFDYVWLVTWLHDHPERPEPPPMTQVPFLLRPTPRRIGVFATRGPRRVNPIGLSLVRLLGVDGRIVRFAGVDMVDGTPVLDLKPYVPAFDRPPGEPRAGWFDDVRPAEGVTPADLG
jgi:tRNA-Thr(GGU) m(6)t(6)A37 methyltransferase TsaA